MKDLFRTGRIQDSGKCNKAIAKLVEAANVDIQADPLLHKACAVDISKFCRDVPHGGGQQLRCLTSIFKDSKFKLERKCEKQLKTRMEMYNKALKIVPLDGVQDLFTQVSLSPHRNYFILLVFTFFSCIFVVGLCCGRVTKKVRREYKDR